MHTGAGLETLLRPLQLGPLSSLRAPQQWHLLPPIDPFLFLLAGNGLHLEAAAMEAQGDQAGTWG